MKSRLLLTRLFVVRLSGVILFIGLPWYNYLGNTDPTPHLGKQCVRRPVTLGCDVSWCVHKECKAESGAHVTCREMIGEARAGVMLDSLIW